MIRLSACSASFAAFLVLLSSVRCANEAERPPPAPACESEDCRLPGLSGAVGVGAGGTGAGSGGEAGGGAGGAGAGGAGFGSIPPGVLSGTVAEIVEPDLRVGAAPSGPQLLVRAPSEQGGQLEAAVSEEGLFRLDGVQPEAGLWVGVGPSTDSGLYVNTVQQASGRAGSLIQLRVMPRSLLEQMVRDFFLVEPLELSTERAYAVVVVTDASGVPLSDVSFVDLPSPEARVAYDAGDIYSDSVESTSLRGAAVLANVPVVDYPGELVALTFEYQGESYEMDARLAAGSLTLATFELSP